MTVGHLPIRPAWTCMACGGPWPCATKRRQFAVHYAEAHVSLALYLASCLVEAAADLPSRPAGLLYEQFLGWLGPPFEDRFPRMPIEAGPGRMARPYVR